VAGWVLAALNFDISSTLVSRHIRGELQFQMWPEIKAVTLT
jgi:hypothetical protein